MPSAPARRAAAGLCAALTSGTESAWSAATAGSAASGPAAWPRSPATAIGSAALNRWWYLLERHVGHHEVVGQRARREARAHRPGSAEPSRPGPRPPARPVGAAAERTARPRPFGGLERPGRGQQRFRQVVGEAPVVLAGHHPVEPGRLGQPGLRHQLGHHLRGREVVRVEAQQTAPGLTGTEREEDPGGMVVACQTGRPGVVGAIGPPDGGAARQDLAGGRAAVRLTHAL